MSNIEYQNVKFRWRDASFYETSKTAREGFVENKYEDKKTKETRINYHRNMEFISGIISMVEIKKLAFGTFLNIRFFEKNPTGGNVSKTLSVPLEDIYGYSNETRSLISALRGYKKGEPVRLTASKKVVPNEKTGKENTYLSFWITYDNITDAEGKRESSGYIPFDEIPKAVKGETRGKVTYDNNARDDFYFAILSKLEAEFVALKAERDLEYQNSKTNGSSAPSSTPPNSTPSNGLTPNEDFANMEEDDLPF